MKPVIRMNTGLLTEGCIIVTSRRADTCPRILEPGVDPVWMATYRYGTWYAITPTGVPTVEVEIVHLDDGVDAFVIASPDKEDLVYDK